jgi:hypothetical protein
MSLILNGTDGLSDVNGSAATPAIRGTDANTGIFFPAADTIAFSEGGAESMRIDSSGNVGIGTSSPVSSAGYTALTLNNATNSGYVILQSNGVTKSDWYSSGGSDATLRGVGVPLNLVATGANYIYATTNGSERMRISSAGDLLVGTTSADSTVVGARIVASATIPQISVAVTTTSNNYLLYNTTAAAYRFFVTSAGVINATTTTITAISDQRWKENIRDLDDGLEKVLALKPRKFDWKEGKGEDKKNARGFIAQELETVFPDMVTEWIDPAPEGEESYKAVNANLIPTLVKAIQELNAKVEAQAAKIAELEAK